MQFNKILLSGASVLMLALTACVGDLDQLPRDPQTIVPEDFNKNPREYLSGAAAKCYSGIAVSGQGGAGDSDMSGIDNGASCWSRAIFMMNEFTTDEASWIWKDAGVFDLCTDTWSTNNPNVFACYSRLYVHIAVCNDFIRLTRNLDKYGIDINQGGGKGISQNELDQFVQEVRALRDLSYFYVIDIFGNAANAWDDQEPATAPPYMTRAELFDKVTADLEDILANWDEVHGGGVPVYGRIGKDAVEALLCKYYLNGEVFRGTATLADGTNTFAKCYQHCQNVINRHQSGPYGNGLAASYLSLFCYNNDMFAPGGSLPDQNEILWTIPYSYLLTESYGGSLFLLASPLTDKTDPLTSNAWYGVNSSLVYNCMHARTQFSEKFPMSDGYAANGDERTYLWLTENAGCTIYNTDFSTMTDGYLPIKFTNVHCNADGTMPLWKDEATGLNRVGVKYNNNANDNYGIDYSASFVDTDYPVIRLAEIYLTAAEAILRGNVGSRAEALKYVNNLRQRAALSEGSLWTDANLTLENILDERARELYWENCRRTDLVRFNMFAGDKYNWNWKNNVPEGSGIPVHMNLFPIPSQVINSYSGASFPQNPGY